MMTILVLAVAVGASGQSLQRSNARMAPAAVQAATDPVTTTRDAQGVWFIEGGSLYDVYEAMGYAVATDRLLQMDLLRRTARGTLSELVGANFLGGDFLGDDIFIRSIMYSDDEYQEMFDGLSEDGQAAVQGYVDGVNRRIFEIYSHWLLMPYEYWAGSILTILQLGLPYNILPEPWTTNDALAWISLLQRNFDGEWSDQGQLTNATLAPTLAAVYGNEGLAMFQDLRWLNDPGGQTMIPAPAGAKSVRTPVQPAVIPDGLPDLRDTAEALRSRIEGRERNLKKLGIEIKMGSYAWAVSGDKTASGNPIVYSGPQMGFSAPAIVTEGSICGGGFEVSGMTVPGIPGIIIGRTPHHAWSMQVGHAHTQDFFIDSPLTVILHHEETIYPAGGEPVTFPVYRTHHGPIVNPSPYDPENPPPYVVSWAYSHWMRDAKTIEAFLQLARATSIAEFGEGIENVAVSQHYTYADRDGNIAYWMSGFDPIRAPGVDPRFPQVGDGTQEWTGERRPLAHAENPDQGYFGGWNNKASVDYISPPNNLWYNNGPAHRAAEVEAYLSTHDNLTFEEVRDLALNIATTDSFMAGDGGGNTWRFVGDYFADAVAADPTPDREAAIAMIDAWDGHFVAGGPSQWRFGTLRADAWVLQDAWVQEVLRLTFEDEFAGAGMSWSQEPGVLLFNVLLHALAGPDASLPTLYNWFQDKLASGKPTTSEGIIVQALDNVIVDLGGLGPYNVPRGVIAFGHPLLSQLPPPDGPAFARLHTIPWSSRSTYAHVVEYGEDGPVRIESMFPLGESGAMYYTGTLVPMFDPNFFSMAPFFDPFLPRSFPLFN
jgi:penicillin amidase